MTQIERSPVWGPSASEVQMAPAGTNSSDVIAMPSGCTGMAISNVSGDPVFITPDTSDPDSGRYLPVGESYFFNIEGAPVIYLNKPAVGAGVVNVLRFFD